MTSQPEFEGLLPSQDEIIAHWHAARGERQLPARRDIDPGQLRAHLANISILEIETGGTARFRLIGTRLQTILGGDMRGLCLDEIEPDKADLWSTGLTRMSDMIAPLAGVQARGRDRHAWLRLPLYTGDDSTKLLLCHDVILKRDKRKPAPFSGFFPSPMRSLAA